MVVKDKELKEIWKILNKISKENDRLLRNAGSHEKSISALEKSVKAQEKSISGLGKNINGISDNLGMEIEDSIEEFFIKKRDKKKLIIGDVNYNSVRKGINENGVFELDFLLVNSTHIALVEVKRNLRLGNISHFFKHTLTKFQERFKEYKDKKINIIFACKNLNKKEAQKIKERIKKLSDFPVFLLEQIKEENFEIHNLHAN